MRLSRESRYAIQALLVLATRTPGELTDAKQIARDAGLPLAYLHKILRQLAVGGVVVSRRGRGFALARGPAATTLRDILVAIEGEEVFGGRCIFWREECSTVDPCELHFRWRELKPAIEDSMARTTLAEILGSELLPVGGT